MGQSLVIVESPSKAKTIGKYLGKNYIVKSSVGHIRDLSTTGPGGLGVDVDNKFAPTYEIIRGKKKVINELIKDAKNADHVYLATDPDREGEAISWHIFDSLNLNEASYHRVVFHEITKDAILKSFENPMKINNDLVKSQESRRILDRIIGFKLSGLLRKKIKSPSAGRVQSVALKLIVDREKEIRAFVPVEYWNINAYFKKINEEFIAKFIGKNGKKQELNKKEDVDKVLNELNENFEVQSISSTDKKKNPKMPFITSTLQQEASNKLRFGSKKTMMIAQQLYEGIEINGAPEGLITYMRTDSTRMSSEFTGAAINKVKAEFGENYLGFAKRETKKSKNAQDAHEAIRPTNVKYDPIKIKQYLNDDQYKLYKLIYVRAISSIMSPAVFTQSAIDFNNNGYTFRTNGSVMKFDGYLKLYKEYEDNKDTMLPNLEEKESLAAKKVEPTQHFTQPPARYTEASLIKSMEELGIGRPSTYAATVDTLKKRNYVEIEKKSFLPTEQGELTSEKLEAFFNTIINVEYTADMETILDEIANGEKVWYKELEDFYKKFMPLLETADKKMEKIAPKETDLTCPECGLPLVIRKGRYGEFTSCSGYPNCKYILKDKKDEPKKTGEPCPECGEGELVVRVAKKGKNKGNEFLACNRFPKCKYVKTEKK